MQPAETTASNPPLVEEKSEGSLKHASRNPVFIKKYSTFDDYVTKLSAEFLYPFVSIQAVCIIGLLASRPSPLKRTMKWMNVLVLAPYYYWYQRSHRLIQAVGVQSDRQTIVVNRGIFTSKYQSIIPRDIQVSSSSRDNTISITGKDKGGNPVDLLLLNKQIYIDEKNAPVDISLIMSLFDSKSDILQALPN